MRDIDFLRDGSHAGAPVIYKYRSGALRAEVWKRLAQQAAGKWQIVSCAPADLAAQLYSISLIPSFIFCDWSGRGARGVQVAEYVFGALRPREDRSFALFLPQTSPLLQHPDWPAVEARALVLEEEEVCIDTLDDWLRYLEATTDLVVDADLIGQAEFREAFATFLEDEHPDAPELIDYFEKFVLTRTDPFSKTFIADRSGEVLLEEERRTSLLRLMRNFVENPRGQARVDIIAAFDRRYHDGWSGHELMAELYRVTESMLRWRFRRRADVKGALIWAAIILAAESRLLRAARRGEDQMRDGPDLAIVILDEIACDYRTRLYRSPEADPLEGLWRRIADASRSLSQADLGMLWRRRARFIDALHATLGGAPDRKLTWVGRYCEAIGAAVEIIAARAGEKTATGEGATQRPADERRLKQLLHPGRFADVIGQESLIRRLCDQQKKSDAGALILYGPVGVGKRTLARVYAKKIMCMGDRASHEPCGECAACRGFDAGLLDYVEFDAKRADTKEHARELAAILRSQPFMARRVIVIANADHYSPEVSDVFLKRLEEPRTNTFFLLLAHNLKGVRRAIVSRCETFRVRPLRVNEAEALVRRLMTARKLELDKPSLDAIVRISAGLPGRLQECILRFDSGRSFTAANVWDALDLRWGNDLLSLWRSDTAKPVPRGGLARALSGREPVRRARLLLAQLLLTRTSHLEDSLAIHPALDELDRDTLRAFLDQVTCIAAARGLTLQEFWSQMARKAVGHEQWGDDPFSNWLQTASSQRAG